MLTEIRIDARNIVFRHQRRGSRAGRPAVVAVGALAAALLATQASAQVAYTDAQGREWRQVVQTVSVSWNAAAAVCPQDGVTPCDGVASGRDLTGWVWATRAQVREMLVEWAPDLADFDSVSGGAYVLPGLSFLDTFAPTFGSYTTFGASFSLVGIACDASGGLASAPWVMAGYNPNQGAFSVASTVSVSTASQYNGLWMFRLPDAPCVADLDGNGLVDGADLTILLGAWNGAKSPADLDADGTVDAADMAVLLNAWGEC